MAWSGLSGGTAAAPAYITTVVNMPPVAAGQNVQLKWRLGSDSSVVPTTNPGAWIDTISVTSPLCGTTSPTLVSAVSRKTHGGATSYDVPLPQAPFATASIGVEPRVGPVPGEHTIVATFANPVTVRGVAVTAGTGSATFSVAGAVVTINLTGVTDVQRIAVTLSDVAAGANVGNIVIPIGVLAGDTNGSLTVSGTDVSQTKAAAASGIVGANSFRTDVNTSNSINASDIGLVKSRSGTVLP
jgi:hypothetical protein